MVAVEVPAPHGRLEGLLETAAVPVGAVVVCHPHPLYGGSMDNAVTAKLSETFARQGFTALRFNFRGVGLSTGAWDEGRGEVDDARCALEFVAKAAPGVPLWVAGYSFGAWVAMEVLRAEARAEKGLAVNVPLSVRRFDFLAQVEKPAAFIHADQDEFGRLSDVRAVVASKPGPARLWVLPDADHGCRGRLGDLSALGAEAIGWLLQSGR